MLVAGMRELHHRPVAHHNGAGSGAELADARVPPELRWQLLRERGYRWDAERRCWHRVVPKAAAKEESEWLKTSVYAGRSAQIEVEVLDAKVRFSGRQGPRKVRVI